MCMILGSGNNTFLLRIGEKLYGYKRFHLAGKVNNKNYQICSSIFVNEIYTFGEDGDAILAANHQDVLLNYEIKDKDGKEYAHTYISMDLGYHCSLLKDREYGYDDRYDPIVLVSFDQEDIQMIGDSVAVRTFKIVTDYKIYDKYLIIKKDNVESVKKMLRKMKRLVNKQKEF